MSSRDVLMNLEALATYEDILLIGIVETLGALCYTFFPPIGVPVAAVALFYFIQRLVDNRTTNMLPMRRTTLMIFITWSSWLAWGIAWSPLDSPLWIKAVYSAVACFTGIHTIRYENRSFIRMNNRAKILTLCIFALGLLPLNNLKKIPPWALWLQGLVHANCIYLTFLLRTKQGLAHNIAALFAYSFWILTVPWQPAIGIASLTAALTLRSLLVEMRKKPVVAEPDTEAPPPRPKPVPRPPPPKSPHEHMIQASRKLKDEKPVESSTFIRPPMFEGVDLAKLKQQAYDS